VTTDFPNRTAAFAIGELAAFSPGPRAVGESGPAARWRTELGTHWHRELRAAAETATPEHSHEVPLRGTLVHRGWRFELEGRVDQLQSTSAGPLIREIKTTLAKLPRAPAELRSTHPAYFVQLGLYLRLPLPIKCNQIGYTFPAARPGTTGELVFVEAGTGLQQVVPFTEADAASTEAHLDLVADFLEQRRSTLERLRTLAWRPAFATPRPGQETIVADLQTALAPGFADAPPPPVVLAAPTGYGKTGVLLEAAFSLLRSGRADRIVYLTGKSTGQLHVQTTLQHMLAPGNAELQLGPPPEKCNQIGYTFPSASSASVTFASPPSFSAWNLRPKREHCINDIYHCTRDRCRFLHDLPRRYREAGLSRFHLFPADARDLPALRAAGLAAQICPYEIARAALPACSVWLGDFNYLFAPANRGVFIDQPTWDPARTLLVIDEAHHLPSRVAEAQSHALAADELHALLAELPDDTARPLRRALETLWRLLASLPAADALDLDAEDDVASALRTASDLLAKHPPDTATLQPPSADLLFRLPGLLAWLEDHSLEKLLWSPRAAEVRFTCLDAAPVIGKQLHEFAAVILATATPPPPDVFAASLGLSSSAGSGPLGIDHSSLVILQPAAPWRAHAYDVALDLRVDTTFRQRERHHPTTAATLAALREASPAAPVVAFFPSYAYAEKILRILDDTHPGLRCALQPRAVDLAGQSAWIDEQLALADILCFVLGGSFAEGIDHLGGRISHALVVGPALPEVNALQRARQTALARATNDTEAFRRTYLVPGLQKVNQALGRLARAPGQHCRVILHCRRFADPAYASLLAPEYQFGQHLLQDADLAAWLARA
jgi:Rad3-related DNA helicase